MSEKENKSFNAGSMDKDNLMPFLVDSKGDPDKMEIMSNSISMPQLMSNSKKIKF